MTYPAILPISPGEVPTEPGWYVGVYKDEPDLVVTLRISNGALWVNNDSTSAPDNFTFIARIYPDRIGEEG